MPCVYHFPCGFLCRFAINAYICGAKTKCGAIRRLHCRRFLCQYIDVFIRNKPCRVVEQKCPRSLHLGFSNTQHGFFIAKN